MNAKEERKLLLCAKWMSIHGIKAELRFADNKCREYASSLAPRSNLLYWEMRREIFLKELESR